MFLEKGLTLSISLLVSWLHFSLGKFKGSEVGIKISIHKQTQRQLALIAQELWAGNLG